MITLQRIQGKLQRELHGSLHNTRQLEALRATGDDVGVRLAGAIETVLTQRGDAEASGWIQRIEALRVRLANDDTVVRGIDFGAGSPGEHRTEQEMQAGVTWQKPVRDIARASKNRRWGELLMHIVRETAPETALELGTCVGISAAYQAAGLMHHRRGQLVTLEGAPCLAELSRSHFAALGLDNVTVVQGDFRSTLGEVLAAADRVDYAYIDGHHDGPATEAYFASIVAKVPVGGVVVFDDIRWSEGMLRAWQTLTVHPRVRLAIDMFQVGLVVVGERRVEGPPFKLAID
jgi:predicted O-methyltransferase YrrM